MIDLVSFGIVIDDIALPDGAAYRGVLGGGGPQTAWGMAAALGTGETVGLVADVGEDFDPQSLAPLSAAHVNVEGIRASSPLTPRAWQHIDANGGRTHVWQSPPLKSITSGTSMRDLLPESYQNAQGFHWGLHPESPVLDDARRLTEMGMRVSLETFKPPEQPLTADELGALMASCSIFSPNWSEAMGITGSSDYAVVIQHFYAAGCQMLALRRGASGAEVWDFRAKKGVCVPAVPTTVVDTVGAGNAFCGALLASLDQGIESAACHAVAAASYLVEQFGLPSQLPTPADYQARLSVARAGLTRLPFPA